MQDDKVDVRILMSHPMESGLRKNSDGELVAALYIVKVSATCRGREVLSADWGPSIAKNPYLSFRFRGAASGDKISITWTDSASDTRTDEVAIK